ncbi:unnamed protein product [Brassica oleracea]
MRQLNLRYSDRFRKFYVNSVNSFFFFWSTGSDQLNSCCCNEWLCFEFACVLGFFVQFDDFQETDQQENTKTNLKSRRHFVRERENQH